jgi:hypothetical protein
MAAQATPTKRKNARSFTETLCNARDSGGMRFMVAPEISRNSVGRCRRYVVDRARLMEHSTDLQAIQPRVAVVAAVDRYCAHRNARS